MRSPILQKRSSCSEILLATRPQVLGKQQEKLPSRQAVVQKKVSSLQEQQSSTRQQEDRIQEGKQQTQDSETVVPATVPPVTAVERVLEIASTVVLATEEVELRNIRQFLEEADKGEEEQLSAIKEALLKLAAAKQRNISMDIKNSMLLIENSLAVIKSCRSMRQNAVEGLLARVAR